MAGKAGKGGGKAAGKGGKSSKTARASMPQGPKGSFQISAEMARIVPLNQGRHAYVRDLEGRTHHLAVGSDGFLELCATLDADGRVTRELAALAAGNPTGSWAGALDALTARQAVVEPVEA